MEDKKSLKVVTKITIILSVMALLIWGVGMYFLTSVTADYAASQYLENNQKRASDIAWGNFVHRLGSDLSYKNFNEYALWEAVGQGSYGRDIANASADSFQWRKSESYGAVAVYDEKGNCMENSWTDFIYFQYMTKDEWEADKEYSVSCARAFIDRNYFNKIGLEMVADGGMGEARALRFTGLFDGVEFTPVRIESIEADDFRDALHKWESKSYTYTVPAVVKESDLQWQTIYENNDLALQGEETTLYSHHFNICYYKESPSFSYNGEDYANLVALLEEIGPAYAHGVQSESRYEGNDMVILSVNSCKTYTVDDKSELVYEDWYSGSDSNSKLHFYTVSAVYCSPWSTAVEELKHIYLLTFCVAAGCVLIARELIKRYLPIRFL